MRIEIEASSHQDRFKPWIARVDFSESPMGYYRFGSFVDGGANTGILHIDAEPGDVIVVGAKNKYRGKSKTKFFLLASDGQLERMDSKATAYRRWKTGQEGGLDREALLAEKERLLARVAEIDAELSKEAADCKHGGES